MEEVMMDEGFYDVDTKELEDWAYDYEWDDGYWDLAWNKKFDEGYVAYNFVGYWHLPLPIWSEDENGIGGIYNLPRKILSAPYLNNN